MAETDKAPELDLNDPDIVRGIKAFADQEKAKRKAEEEAAEAAKQAEIEAAKQAKEEAKQAQLRKQSPGMFAGLDFNRFGAVIYIRVPEARPRRVVHSDGLTYEHVGEDADGVWIYSNL